ncbi:hypothetical protein ACSBOB_18615 [Mesorhizobium sp. ASY16-5R]|uniref:hypothetical protein n=1 Tax=Mesorhizobium sp. ASY16-5R TaxID=3445772 RepID=UPI003F9FA92A
MNVNFNQTDEEVVADDCDFIRGEGATEAEVKAHAAGLRKELHRAREAGEFNEDAPIPDGTWADETGRYRGAWEN